MAVHGPVFKLDREEGDTGAGEEPWGHDYQPAFSKQSKP
jgi:hypothetical protein